MDQVGTKDVLGYCIRNYTRQSVCLGFQQGKGHTLKVGGKEKNIHGAQIVCGVGDTSCENDLATDPQLLGLAFQHWAILAISNQQKTDIWIPFQQQG